MEKNIVGKRVKEARLKLVPHLTQADLATRLQLSGWQIDRGGIAKIENGFRRVTDKEVTILARALNITTSWLLGENDENC